MTFNGFSKIYVEGELENNYGTVRASGSATATSNESIVDADSQAQIIATSVANSQLENDINVIQQTISIAIAKTITGPTVNYNSVNQNISSNTSKKNSIYYQTPAKINDTQIIAKLDNDVNLQQVYTFGPSIPNRWVAVGQGPNSIAYSNDGINWTGIGNSIFSNNGFGVAGNSKIGSVVVPSQMVLNNSSINGSNQLDICSESYYNTGFTNATFTIASSNL